MTIRLDKLIAQQGLASSRERAQILINSGLVEVDGVLAEKPSQLIAEDAEIRITGEALPYVGRGGLKLEAALRQMRVNVKDAVCLDVGASTGGFTDCLLQRGARRVVAIDVGHGQMAPSLSADPRVELREGVNARYISPEQFDTLFDVVTIDVSFISVTLVLPTVAALLRPGGHVLCLVKPEYESGPNAVDSRGVLRDANARHQAISKVVGFMRDQLGLHIRGTMPSPIVGGRGNRETFVYARRPAEETAEAATE